MNYISMNYISMNYISMNNLDNSILVEFTTKLSDIDNLDINIDFKLTKLLSNITKSDYAYFNNLIFKNKKPFNLANFMIDNTNKLSKEIINKIIDTEFPLENNKNKIWSSNFYFPDKISCFDMDIEYKKIPKKCPIKILKYLTIIPLIYNKENVGCICLNSNKTNYDIIKKSLYCISNIISHLIWSHKAGISKLEVEQEKKLLKQEQFFISQISHELKTPLNAIIGFTQLLQEDLSNSKEFLDYILENSNNLMYLINNVLNLNRLDFYKTNKKYFNFTNLINKQINEHITRNDINLNINIDPIFINSDFYLVTILLNNLITNINKYCSENGEINIYSRIDYLNKKCNVYFENSGFMKIKLNQMYTPFNQGCPTNKGHGLGLSIIKKVINILGFIIEFKQLNNLVQFKVSFYNIMAKSHKFVYLEDNKFNQLLMKNLFKNHHLDIKDNAHNFLEYISHYDFILLDWHLNHINGQDVIKLAKEHNINIPIIVITADTNPNILKYINRKNIKYFTKPINIKEFKTYFKQIYNLEI